MATQSPPARPEPAHHAPSDADATAAPAVAEHRCPNCDADAPHEFCARCGQPQRDRLRVSLRTLAAETVEELTELDGRFATTLRLLVTRPGRLTTEYLAGRRARYVRPLRLYLTTSVLFFVAFAIGSRGVEPRAGERTTVLGIHISEPVVSDDGTPPAAPAPAAPDAGLTVGGDPEDSRVERAVEDRMARFARQSQAEQVRTVVDAMQRHVPKAFFVLVPLSALLLHAVHWRRGMSYAEHLIFALHVHAFGFLIMAPAVLLPAVARGIEDTIAGLWLAGYTFVALRRTYGGSRLATAARLAVIGPVYMTAVVMGLLGVVFAALLL